MMISHWSTNIAKLREIETKDPIFWQYLTKLAQTISACDYKYIDEHRLPFCATEESLEKKLEYEANATRDIEYLTICQKYKPDGSLKTLKQLSKYDTPYPSMAWVFPGPYAHSLVMCKNPIYIDNERVYLTTAATGSNLNRAQQDKLFNGETVTQIQDNEFYHIHEENFSFPVDVFVKTMLNASIKN